VYKQATVLTYIDTFRYLGIFFLLVIPLILFAKDLKKVNPQDAANAAH
jgi:MFS transporter, DHA2 family, multidrug resistance protein